MIDAVPHGDQLQPVFGIAVEVGPTHAVGITRIILAHITGRMPISLQIVILVAIDSSTQRRPQNQIEIPVPVKITPVLVNRAQIIREPRRGWRNTRTGIGDPDIHDQIEIRIERTHVDRDGVNKLCSLGLPEHLSRNRPGHTRTIRDREAYPLDLTGDGDQHGAALRQRNIFCLDDLLATARAGDRPIIQHVLGQRILNDDAFCPLIPLVTDGNRVRQYIAVVHNIARVAGIVHDSVWALRLGRQIQDQVHLPWQGEYCFSSACIDGLRKTPDPS